MTRLITTVIGVMTSDAQPYQPWTRVRAVIARKVASPQSRQNGPGWLSNRITMTKPW
ncbi:hypothetical protein [Actinoplanes auranticolor]|uniref:hypothetical protein n=1 Tax=Actinoplanes auranticolor TaxID=47988 RepID=UPI001BB3D4FC|nr:hypothetical protein [Actinoplanes auranticolor]